MFLFILSSLFICITLSSSGVCNDGDCDYCLSQDDFNNGTYRILESGKYCLSENIIFNPNPSDYTSPNIPYYWFPSDDHDYPGCEALEGGGYALGFFAAVTIEVNDVELDLKKYSIEMDKEFYIQQRFFSIIEVNMSPFITGMTLIMLYSLICLS